MTAVADDSSASIPDGLHQGTCLVHIPDIVVMVIRTSLLDEFPHERIFRHTTRQREREDDRTIKIGNRQSLEVVGEGADRVHYFRDTCYNKSVSR